MALSLNEEAQLLTDYYLNQAGQGFSGIYSGVPWQRGTGIGSWLGGLFRAVVPLLKKGGIAITREVARGASNLLNDLTDEKGFKESIKTRGEEVLSGVSNAVKTITGSGYRRPTTRRKPQSRTSTRKKRTTSTRTISTRSKTRNPRSTRARRRSRSKPKVLSGRVAKRAKKTRSNPVRKSSLVFARKPDYFRD